VFDQLHRVPISTTSAIISVEKLIVVADDLKLVRYGECTPIHCSIVNKLILGTMVAASHPDLLLIRRASVFGRRAVGDMQERKLN
jgi:hypothetical protein